MVVRVRNRDLFALCCLSIGTGLSAQEASDMVFVRCDGVPMRATRSEPQFVPSGGDRIRYYAFSQSTQKVWSINARDLNSHLLQACSVGSTMVECNAGCSETAWGINYNHADINSMCNENSGYRLRLSRVDGTASYAGVDANIYGYVQQAGQYGANCTKTDDPRKQQKAF